ncbi:hypothetical protein BGZ96_003289 [Linnemannia gamsii]|uniref:non-specific serine/threonine protein kinase n=1 Tax=Linnemannia gamsii TaxID=64522 RepID=A0ABQ7JJG8_9FUNG|nr:hypothetical protein BGZ96_003289 [Linnemannia gamsii]
MNCREQVTTDKDDSFYQSNQLLSVPFKERSTVAFNHQTENHKSVDLNDFIETVAFGGDGTFDYIGQALGCHRAPIEETLALEEQTLSIAVEDIKEEEENKAKQIEADEKEEQIQFDIHEEHVLVVHLEESSVTVAPVAPVVKSIATGETSGDYAHEVSPQTTQDVVQEPTQAYKEAPVDVVFPIESLKAVPKSSIPIVPTSASIDTLESKDVSLVPQSHQSSGQLSQRQDGSMVIHSFPHEPLRGSQLLENRQQRQNSYPKLNGSSLLHLKTSRQSNHSGPPSMLASSSTSGSTASSATRLQTPQTCNGSTFERNTAMSEDDVSMSSTSGQSSHNDRCGSSIKSSSAETNIATGGGGGGGGGEKASTSTAPPSTASSSRKPAKIVTRPRGLSMALGRTFSMMLDITSAATTVGFDDESQHDHVVSSKVSRTGKLFAQKIKTISNFEYNTSKKLGKGNFGVVYQGKSIQGDEEVAIKKITRKLPGEIEKLGLVQREMKVCRLFRNKTGIVPLLDIITTNKHHYLVFEKAEGDLAEMIKARCKDATGVERITRDPYQQPMSPSCTLGAIFNINEIRSIMRTVVLGAQSLHHEGFSHKDIKPANILFCEGHGLLCDFGLCSQREELPDNQFFGTQDYASPEARRVGGSKKCDYIQGDVYSLGAVLYELATGAVLSKVISQGINWQKLALFGGRSFSELIQGMVDDLEKRWTIDRVVGSQFWDEPQSDSASTMTAVSDSLPFSPLSVTTATAVKLMRQAAVGAGGGHGVSDTVLVGTMGTAERE